MLVLLLACVHRPPSPPDVATADPLIVAYAAGLADARDPRPSEVVTDLIAIVPGAEGLGFDESGRVLVHTWTRSRFYADPAYVAGYEFPLYGETFFTTGTQVRDACAGLQDPDLSLRVEQLLGLPPGGGRDAFLTVAIDPKDLFRPCADPDVTTHTCPLAAPLVAGDGDTVSWACGAADATPHQRWMCDTWVNRYGSSEVTSRFPWTGLGYTYDWRSADRPEGPSEFVARAGTKVVFRSIAPNADFCTVAQ